MIRELQIVAGGFVLFIVVLCLFFLMSASKQFDSTLNTELTREFGEYIILEQQLPAKERVVKVIAKEGEFYVSVGKEGNIITIINASPEKNQEEDNAN